MYIYDLPKAGSHPRLGSRRGHLLGVLGAPVAGAFTIPGAPLNAEADYILAPVVMEAAAKVLATAVPAGHLAALGSTVNPLLVERGVSIFRFDDGTLQVGAVTFGTSPRTLKLDGSTQSGTTTVHTLQADSGPWRRIDAQTGIETQGSRWLVIHTHPAVQAIPAVPSGIVKQNPALSGDFNLLTTQTSTQTGILTIGSNQIIPDLQMATAPIPFSLAIRDPVRGPTNVNNVAESFANHEAAAKALRLIFRKPTACGYYVGDLRNGRAAPYPPPRGLKRAAKSAGS